MKRITSTNPEAGLIMHTPPKEDRQPNETISPVSAFESYKENSNNASPAGVNELRDLPTLIPDELFSNQLAIYRNNMDSMAQSNQISRCRKMPEYTRVPSNNLVGDDYLTAGTTAYEQHNLIEKAREYVISGHSYLEQNIFEKAIYSYKTALAMFGVLVGDIDVEAVNARIFLGKAYEAVGNFLQALSCIAIARRLWISLHGRNHILVAESSVSIGAMYWQMGKLNWAIKEIKKGIRLMRIVPGGYVKLPDTIESLSSLYYLKNDFQKALLTLKDAYISRINMYGVYHIDVCATIIKIGHVLREQGDIHKSLHVLLKALSIQRKVIGENHLEVATTLTQIGDLYLLMNKTEQAIHMFKLSINISKHDISSCDQVATRLLKVASIYESQGMLNNALIYFEKARKVYQKFYSLIHPQCVVLLSSLGKLYYHQGDYRQSMEVFNELLVCEECLFGVTDPQVVDTKSMIAITMWTFGNLLGALAIFAENVKMIRKMKGKKNIKVATYLCNIGLLNNELGRHESALDAFAEALDIIRNRNDVTASCELTRGCAFTGTFDSVIRQIESIMQDIRKKENTISYDEDQNYSFLDNINSLCRNTLFPLTSG